MKLYKSEDYHEDYGECIFFHFFSLSEPADACSGSPLDAGWDDEWWTHFIRLDFNDIFDQVSIKYVKETNAGNLNYEI